MAESAENKNELESTKQNTDELGLGVAQIVITAATPMEEIERTFPLTGGTEIPETPSPKKSTESDESMEFQKAVTGQDVSQTDLGFVETSEETNEIDEKSTVDDLPTDSAPFPISSSSSSEADSTSGSSTAHNSQLAFSSHLNTAIEMQKENETSDEQPDIIPEKMLVGGRASIPDELQPDQLEKLQNLKESNA